MECPLALAVRWVHHYEPRDIGRESGDWDQGLWIEDMGLHSGYLCLRLVLELGLSLCLSRDSMLGLSEAASCLP